MEGLGLRSSLRLYSDARPNRIAVAFRPAQEEGDGMPYVSKLIPQNSNLRRIPVLEDELQAAILVNVGERKGSAVLGEVQSRRCRDV